MTRLPILLAGVMAGLAYQCESPSRVPLIGAQAPSTSDCTPARCAALQWGWLMRWGRMEAEHEPALRRIFPDAGRIRISAGCGKN
jgi:hypothetical protein